MRPHYVFGCSTVTRSEALHSWKLKPQAWLPFGPFDSYTILSTRELKSQARGPLTFCCVRQLHDLKHSRAGTQAPSPVACLAVRQFHKYKHSNAGSLSARPFYGSLPKTTSREHMFTSNMREHMFREHMFTNMQTLRIYVYT